MNDCIFCAIAAHELPATFVREDDEVFAIRDVNPQAPVHVLDPASRAHRVGG